MLISVNRKLKNKFAILKIDYIEMKSLILQEDFIKIYLKS